MAVSAAFIASKDEEKEARGRRLFAYEAVLRSREHRRVLEFSGGKDLRSKVQDVDDREAYLEESYRIACKEFPGIEKGSTWSGLRIPEMLRRIDDEEVRKVLTFYYELAYRSLSAYVHPSVPGVRVVIPTAERPAILDFEVATVAALSTVGTVRYCSAAFDIAPPDTDSVFRDCIPDDCPT